MNIFLKSKQIYFRWSLILALLVSLGAATVWSWVVVAGALGVRLLYELQLLKLPYRWLTVALSASLFVFTYLEFGTFIGLEAATTLVFGLTGFKLLETRTQRDLEFLQLLVLALLGIALLSLTEFYFLAPVVSGFILLLRQWIGPESHSFKPKMHLSKLMLWSLPIAAAMFVVFPRLDNQIIFAFQPARQAVTGFSEEVSPGWIESLEVTNTLAFRVSSTDISDEALSKMYWKAMSLDQGEGLNWKRSAEYKRAAEKELKADGAKVSDADSKTIIALMEPHLEKWIFAPYGTAEVKSTKFSVKRGELGDFQYLKTLEQKDQLTFLIKDEEEVESAFNYLEVPEMNEELKAWIQSRFSRGKKPEEIAQEIKAIFFSELKYTLRPKPSKSIDDFLLVNKEGFCEHFSGAAASVLRSLGVPARLAIGYRGSIKNSFGEFSSVYSSQAHAWVEYKDSFGKWQILDATPPSSNSLLSAVGINSKNEITWKSLWSQTQDLIQVIDYQWSRTIIEFNREKQVELVNSLKSQLLNILVYLFAGVALIAAFLWQFKKRERTKSILRQVQHLSSLRLEKSKEVHPEIWLANEMQKAGISEEERLKYLNFFKKEIYQDKVLTKSELRQALKIYKKMPGTFI